MKAIGTSIWVIGAIIVLAATFGYDTSTSSAGSDYLPGRIVNLDLQQHQLIFVLAGLAIFLAGVMTHLCGIVLEEVGIKTSRHDVIATPRNFSQTRSSTDGQSGKTEIEMLGIVRGADGWYHLGFERYEPSKKPSPLPVRLEKTETVNAETV